MSEKYNLPPEEESRLKDATQGPIYKEADSNNKTPWIAFWSWWVVLVLLLPSVIFGCVTQYEIEHHVESIRISKGVIIALWGLGVPCWFAFEHWYLFRKYGRPQAFDQFKHQQELISRIWLAALAILSALYFGFPGK